MFYSEAEQKWKHHITVNGKRITTLRANSKQELEKLVKEKEAQINKKINFDWKKASVNDLIKLFVEENKESWEKSTYNWYDAMLKHLEREIGKMKIWDVTTDDLNRMLKQLSKNNPNTDEPSSKRLIFCLANITRQVFKMAYAKRLIEYDPAAVLKTPKQSNKSGKEKQGTRVLTLKEIGWIINTPHELQTANMIMLYTGMRSEELLALKWNDIDIKNRTINVNKALKYDGDKPYLGSTKTGKERTVLMPPDLYDYLKGVYPKKKKDALVVCNSKGEYYSKSGWRSKYKSYIKDLDIRYGGKFKSKCSPHYQQTIQGWTPYSLRHTSSTYGAVFGVNRKQLADNQGHDLATMQKYYEGDLLELRKKEIEKISYKKILEELEKQQEN